MRTQAATTVAGSTSDRTARAGVRLLHVLTGVLLALFLLYTVAIGFSVLWWSLR